MPEGNATIWPALMSWAIIILYFTSIFTTEKRDKKTRAMLDV